MSTETDVAPDAAPDEAYDDPDAASVDGGEGARGCSTRVSSPPRPTTPCSGARSCCSW